MCRTQCFSVLFYYTNISFVPDQQWIIRNFNNIEYVKLSRVNLADCKKWDNPSISYLVAPKVSVNHSIFSFSICSERQLPLIGKTNIRDSRSIIK